MPRPRFLTCLVLAAGLIFTSAPNFAQEQQPTYSSKKPEPKGPRAIAVLEWTGKTARLVPITIKIDDKFYDAGIYQAQPIPMALDTGVIYEIQKAGEPLGDFTLDAAQQTQNGNWFGIGKFESKEELAKEKEASAKERAAEATPAKEEDEGPPRLVRAKPKESTDSGGKSGETKPSDAKPSDSKTESSNAESNPAHTKTVEPAKTSPPASASASSTTPTVQGKSDDDSGRPVLKREAVKQEIAKGVPKEPPTPAITPAATPTKTLTPPPPGLTTMQVAVSDAGNTQPHEYKWSWANPEEEKKLRAQAEKLAFATVSEYAAKMGGPKPGKLEDVTMNVYDLSYSNAPDIILSARVVPEAKPVATKRGAKAAEAPVVMPGFEYYVTIVGREDIYAQLQKSLAIATDNKHLDAFPRMQLIDVVDVDGNGAGDLLFRSISDTGSAFVIYRDLGYRLDEVIRVPAPKG